MEERLDRVNLLDYVESHIPTDKILFSRIIQDAANNYLYAITDKGCPSIEEFFSAWQYLFNITSNNKRSWEKSRSIKISYDYRGNKITENRYLEDTTLKLMCFDKHYELSGLSEYMDIDKFRKGLRSKREQILKDRWEHVVTKIKALHDKELGQITDGKQLPLPLWNEDLLTTLTYPSSPESLANAVYVSKKLKSTSKRRSNKKTNQGKYSKLVSTIEHNSFEKLKDNWGPLASLGVSND